MSAHSNVPVHIQGSEGTHSCQAGVKDVCCRVSPVKVPAAAGTVMSVEPLKGMPLIFLAVCNTVAVAALPLKAPLKVAAVIVPVPVIL